MKALALAFGLLLQQTTLPEQNRPDLARNGERAGLILDEKGSSSDRQTLGRFGDCVVRKFPAEVEQAVLGWPIDPKSVNILYKIDSGTCLSAVSAGTREIKIKPAMMRYVLADALARSRLKTLEMSAAAKIAPLRHPSIDEMRYAPAAGEKFDEAQSKRKAELRASFANFVDLSRLGECAVRGDVESAKDLLDAEPGSTRENAAFQYVLPALEKCLGASTIYGDKVALRGEIATSFLRLAQAQMSLIKQDAE